MATADLLGIEAEMGLRWAGDARGPEPFVPVLDGRRFPVPQLPVSLPTLDERLGRRTPGEFAGEVLSLARDQPGYSCFTAHAETEGRLHRDVLARILEGIGRPAAPLGETPLEGLPEREMRLAPIDGRPYPVCRSAGASPPASP